jgi:hypothetical protein
MRAIGAAWWCAAAVVLACGPLRAEPHEGEYRRADAARDRMMVRLLPSGELAVRIETVGPNGQTCEVDEVLQVEGDVAAFRDLEIAARDWTMTFDGDRAVIAYDGAQRGYCGPGASFRGEWRREAQ